MAIDLTALQQISIPYGAIKRKELRFDRRALINFNSLWCD